MLATILTHFAYLRVLTQRRGRQVYGFCIRTLHLPVIIGAREPKRTGVHKFTQLHVVTSQFVCLFLAHCARGSKLELDPDMLIGPQEAQYKDPCEVNFHLQLALVLRVLVLYL